MASGPIYIGSDKAVVLTGLSGTSVAGVTAYLNAATVTWELFDADDASVADGSLTYVAASDGNYRGVIESTVTADLVKGEIYTVVVTASQGAYNGEWVIAAVAAYRGSC